MNKIWDSSTFYSSLASEWTPWHSAHHPPLTFLKSAFHISHFHMLCKLLNEPELYLKERKGNPYHILFACTCATQLTGEGGQDQSILGSLLSLYPLHLFSFQTECTRSSNASKPKESRSHQVPQCRPQ